MYLSSGGTDSFCGTVKMSMIDSMKYIYAIARSLLEQDFRRQIYIPAHGPSKLLVHPVIQQLLDDTKVPMLLLEPHDLFSVKGVTPRRNMDFGARKFKPLSDEAGLGEAYMRNLVEQVDFTVHLDVLRRLQEHITQKVIPAVGAEHLPQNRWSM